MVYDQFVYPEVLGIHECPVRNNIVAVALTYRTCKCRLCMFDIAPKLLVDFNILYSTKKSRQDQPYISYASIKQKEAS